MTVLIRKEENSDIEAIYNFYCHEFGQQTEAQLINLIRESHGFVPELSLVAIVNNDFAAHILFSRIKIQNESGQYFDSLALAPMAVKPSLQKQGIGGKLILQGLKTAKELLFSSVVVLGHSLYYPKFGFIPAREWNIQAPFPVNPFNYMAIQLVENGLKNVSGTVIYPEAFDIVI